MNLHGDHFTIYPILCCASETNKFTYQLYLNQKKKNKLEERQRHYLSLGVKNKGKVETQSDLLL